MKAYHALQILLRTLRGDNNPEYAIVANAIRELKRLYDMETEVTYALNKLNSFHDNDDSVISVVNALSLFSEIKTEIWK